MLTHVYRYTFTHTQQHKPLHPPTNMQIARIVSARDLDNKNEETLKVIGRE